MVQTMTLFSHGRTQRNLQYSKFFHDKSFLEGPQVQPITQLVKTLQNPQKMPHQIPNWMTHGWWKSPFCSSTTCIPWHPGMACHSCRSHRSCQAVPLWHSCPVGHSHRGQGQLGQLGQLGRWGCWGRWGRWRGQGRWRLNRWFLGCVFSQEKSWVMLVMLGNWWELSNVGSGQIWRKQSWGLVLRRMSQSQFGALRDLKRIELGLLRWFQAPNRPKGKHYPMLEGRQGE